MVQAENRSTGMVKMRLYRVYFRLLGNWVFWLLVFFLIIGSRCLDIAATWWVKEWAQSYNPVTSDIFSVTRSTSEWPSIIQPSKINSFDFISSIFSDDDKSAGLNKYLGIYVLINATNILLGITRYCVMFWGGIRASRELYTMLLDRIAYAPLRFFDTHLLVAS